MPTGERTRYLVAAVAIVALVGLATALVYTAPGQQLDDLSAEAAAALKVWTRDSVPWRLLKGAVVVVLIAVPVVGLGWGWMARPIRRRSVLVGAGVIAVSFGIAQVAKDLLPRPDLLDRVTPLPFNTMPSGHATAAAATVVACYLVSDARWRPLVRVLGAIYVGVIVGFVLLTAMHRLSDILAAFAVVGTVTTAVSMVHCVEAEETGVGVTALLRSVAIGLGVIALIAFAHLAVDVRSGVARPEQFTGLVAAIVSSCAWAALLAAGLAALGRGRAAGGPAVTTSDRVHP